MRFNSFKYIMTFISLLVQSVCSHGTAMNIHTNDSIQRIILQEIQSQYIVGSFSGNGRNDTLRVQYYSDEYEFDIKEIPSMENDWDSIIKWFSQTHQTKIFIACATDTLFFESAYNMLFFFNMGDVNSDGIDEFAMVVNWLDYSNINSCRIYSICDQKFSLLKIFGIHESVFPQNDTKDTPCGGIKGFLEKENNVWRYCDYDNDEDGIMDVLQLEKCNKGTSAN